MPQMPNVYHVVWSGLTLSLAHHLCYAMAGQGQVQMLMKPSTSHRPLGQRCHLQAFCSTGPTMPCRFGLKSHPQSLYHDRCSPRSCTQYPAPIERGPLTWAATLRHQHTRALSCEATRMLCGCPAASLQLGTQVCVQACKGRDTALWVGTSSQQLTSAWWVPP